MCFRILLVMEFDRGIKKSGFLAWESRRKVALAGLEEG